MPAQDDSERYERCPSNMQDVHHELLMRIDRKVDKLGESQSAFNERLNAHDSRIKGVEDTITWAIRIIVGIVLAGAVGIQLTGCAG